MLDRLLWLIVFVLAFVVIYTSTAPPSGDPPPLSDKLLHYLEYAALTLSVLLAALWAPIRGVGRFRISPLAVVLLVFVFGLAIEVVQAPLPERDAEILDALANGGGALSALIAWTLLRVASENGRAGGKRSA